MWKQPKDTEELLSRLADARDLAVPERERENLCACAFTALTEARAALAERDATVQRLEAEYQALDEQTSRYSLKACDERMRADKAEADLAALRAEQDQTRSALRELAQLADLNRLAWIQRGTELDAANAAFALADETNDSLRQQYSDAKAGLERVRAALRRYGMHDPSCGMTVPPRCTCGFDAAFQLEEHDPLCAMGTQAGDQTMSCDCAALQPEGKQP